MKHKQVILKLEDGESISVDVGVRELIAEMNKCEGIHTSNSCQDAYVQFEGVRGMALVHYLVDAMDSVRHASHYKPDPTCRHAMIPTKRHRVWLGGLYFGASPDGYVLRWNPYDYPKLLKAIKGFRGAQSASDTKKVTDDPFSNLKRPC